MVAARLKILSIIWHTMSCSFFELFCDSEPGFSRSTTDAERFIRRSSRGEVLKAAEGRAERDEAQSTLGGRPWRYEWCCGSPTCGRTSESAPCAALCQAGLRESERTIEENKIGAHWQDCQSQRPAETICSTVSRQSGRDRRHVRKLEGAARNLGPDDVLRRLVERRRILELGRTYQGMSASRNTCKQIETKMTEDGSKRGANPPMNFES